MQRKYKNWVPSEIQGNITELVASLKKFEVYNNWKKKETSVKAPCNTMNAALQINPRERFVHTRHACNGCAMTPIIGTRYHSTKVPEVDFCASCFTKYEGDKLDFTPEIQGM